MRLLRIQHFCGFYYVNRSGLEINFFKKNIYASMSTQRYMWKKSFIFFLLNGFTFSIIHFTSFTQQITWLDALIADECE